MITTEELCRPRRYHGGLKKVDVPEGRRGAWQVERFVVDDHGARWHNLRSIMSGHGRGVEPGTYTRLLYWDRNFGDVVMSDTPAEMLDHQPFVQRAQGWVLINGLGLGLCLQVLDDPKVEHATVVEISPDVVALVGPHYQARYGDRLVIVEADALTWQPPKGTRYGAVWHDIWTGICSDNWGAMVKLSRKYARRARWQGAWCKYEVLRQRQGGR